MASTALILGGLAAGGVLGGSAVSAHASGSAASQQTAADQAAIAEQQREFDIAQGNAKPFVQAGQQSIGQLMTDLQNGKFNVGPAPQYTGGSFTAPTEAEAEATPGYEFTKDQGTKVLQQQLGAQGQSASGGELQALDRFTTGLADSTYNDVFSRSLSTYNAGLSQYQAQLAGYGANLTGEAQEYGQELAPAQLGSGQASSINSIGQQSATSIGQLMQNIGGAQAGGTVGTATAINGGIGSAINGGLNAYQLYQLANQSKAPVTNPAGPGGQSTYDVG